MKRPQRSHLVAVASVSAILALAAPARAAFDYISAQSGNPNPMNVSGIVQTACFEIAGNNIYKNSACAGTKSWQVVFPVRSTYPTTSTWYLYITQSASGGDAGGYTAYSYTNTGLTYSSTAYQLVYNTGESLLGTVPVPSGNGTINVISSFPQGTTRQWHSVAYGN